MGTLREEVYATTENARLADAVGMLESGTLALADRVGELIGDMDKLAQRVHDLEHPADSAPANEVPPPAAAKTTGKAAR